VKKEPPGVLNRITDRVLAYKPKDKEKQPRKRKPKKRKEKSGESNI